MHDSTRPIGASTEMIIEKKGVRARGKINLETELGREIYSGMKFSPPYIDRTSIGFVDVDSDYDRKTNVRTIKELKLMEFSLITRNFSANSEALVQSVKADNNMTDLLKRLATLEEKLSDMQKGDDLQMRVKKEMSEKEMSEMGKVMEGLNSMQAMLSSLSDRLAEHLDWEEQNDKMDDEEMEDEEMEEEDEEMEEEDEEMEDEEEEEMETDCMAGSRKALSHNLGSPKGTLAKKKNQEAAHLEELLAGMKKLVRSVE